MLDTLHDLVRESLILERLSPAARRARRSRSMGIEFEFASNKDAPTVANLLNELLGKTRAFGSRLNFRSFNIENKGGEGGGIPRHFVVTTDPTAAHLPGGVSFEDMADDLSHEMARDITDSYGDYEKEWFDEEHGRVKDELEEGWHEAVDQVTDLLDKSEDSEEIRGLIDGLRARDDKDMVELEKYADLLDSDEEAADEFDRPDFDYDQISAWIKRLNDFYREKLAKAAGVDEDDLIHHENRGQEDLESRVGNGQTEWSDVTARWIKKNFGEEESQFFNTKYDDLIHGEDSIQKGLLAWMVDSKPKKIVDQFESLNIGLEVNSPRIAFTERGIAEASKVFELIYKKLSESDQVNVHTHSEAGLHVHVGIGDDVKDIHLIRLLYAMSKDEAELVQLAGREPNQDFASLGNWKDELDASVQQAIETKDPKHVEDHLEDHGKSEESGENTKLLANLDSVKDKGTVEIRLGSSQLASSGTLEKWLLKILQLFQDAVAEDYLEVEGGHRLTLDGRNIQITSPDQGDMHHVAVRSKPTYHTYGFEPGQELQGLVKPGESREQMKQSGEPLTQRPPGFHRKARKARQEEPEPLQRESFSGIVGKFFGETDPDLESIESKKNEFDKPVVEVVQLVRNWLQGEHQVVYLGRAGWFDLYRVLPVTDVERSVLDGNAQREGKSETPFGKRVITFDEYKNGVEPVRKHNPLFKADPVLTKGADRLIAAAKDATKNLTKAGMQRQRRVVVFREIDDVNSNTGGGVAGYASKDRHGIELDPGSSDDFLREALAHEWAHHQWWQLSKESKKWFLNWFNENVIQPVVKSRTDPDDLDSYHKSDIAGDVFKALDDYYEKTYGASIGTLINMAFGHEVKDQDAIWSGFMQGWSNVVGRLKQPVEVEDLGELPKGSLVRLFRGDVNQGPFFSIERLDADVPESQRLGRIPTRKPEPPEVIEFDAKRTEDANEGWDVSKLLGIAKEAREGLESRDSDDFRKRWLYKWFGKYGGKFSSALSKAFWKLDTQLRNIGRSTGKMWMRQQTEDGEEESEAWDSIHDEMDKYAKSDSPGDQNFYDVFIDAIVDHSRWDKVLSGEEQTEHVESTISRKEGNDLKEIAFRLGGLPSSYAASNVQELWAETVAYVSTQQGVSPALKKALWQVISGSGSSPVASEGFLGAVQRVFGISK